MMTYFKTIAWLLLILMVWTFLLVSNPFGWYRLYLAGMALIADKYKSRAFKRWKRDDELINWLFGGSYRQTISGHIGYKAIETGLRRYVFAQTIVNALFWFDPHHCFRSINWLLYPEKMKKYIRKYAFLNQLPLSGDELILST